MSNTDEKIRAALDSDDQAFLDGLDEERGIFRQYGDTFSGSMRWLVVAVNIIIFAVSALGIYAIWGFLNAQGTDSLIKWAALGWVAWTLQIALKNWLWDRMNMLSILREVKRLQVQVAILREG